MTKYTKMLLLIAIINTIVFIILQYYFFTTDLNGKIEVVKYIEYSVFLYILLFILIYIKSISVVRDYRYE